MNIILLLLCQYYTAQIIQVILSISNYNFNCPKKLMLAMVNFQIKDFLFITIFYMHAPYKSTKMLPFLNILICTTFLVVYRWCYCWFYLWPLGSTSRPGPCLTPDTNSTSSYLIIQKYISVRLLIIWTLWSKKYCK